MDFEAIKELLFNYLRRLDQDEMQALMSYLSLLVQEFNSDHFKFKGNKKCFFLIVKTNILNFFFLKYDLKAK